MGIFKQLQKVGRLAPWQPAPFQGNHPRALALDVLLGLQDMPFRHLDFVGEGHEP